MSWVVIDDGVPNHPKFLEAGPAAAWLWVCGLAYARRHHTNGFIPRAALVTLGVQNARPLADRLVKVRLWDTGNHGWQVHDYSVQYGDDAQAKAEKEERARQKREAGKKGGQVSAAKRKVEAPGVAGAQAETDLLLEAESNQSCEAHRNGEEKDLVGSVEERSGEKPADPPKDVMLRQLQVLYPQERVTIGHLTEHAFLKVFERDSRDPQVVFADLLANVALQKQSEQWRAGKVPRLDRYLSDGLYQQRPKPAAEVAGTGSGGSAAMVRSREKYGREVVG